MVACSVAFDAERRRTSYCISLLPRNELFFLAIRHRHDAAVVVTSIYEVFVLYTRCFGGIGNERFGFASGSRGRNPAHIVVNELLSRVCVAKVTPGFSPWKERRARQVAAGPRRYPSGKYN